VVGIDAGKDRVGGLANTEMPSPSPKRSVTDTVAHVLAVWFGCGHFPKAPGTAGTLGAIPLFLLIRSHGPRMVLVVTALLTVVGIWAAGRVARRVGKKDPQIICIDEVAGVFVTWTAAPQTTAGLIVAVVLFRILDQVKPWPAKWAERRLPGGAGIVLDDVFAGLWGAAVLLGARRFGIL
jgi:phosphatidylglycerophosphatase A